VVTDKQEMGGLTLLNAMYHTADASHDCMNIEGCLEGMWKDILFQLGHWLVDERDHQVFWLNGLVGAGGSMIAQTSAEMSFVDNRLSASFFCSQDFEDRRSLKVIFLTLAFQLTYRYPSS